MTTGTTNANGLCQIGLYPFNSLVNDRVCVYGSTNAFTPPAGLDFNYTIAALGNIGSFSNSPYASAVFAENFVQARLVGMGIKVRYAGTELNRAGTIVMYRSQSNIPLLSGTEAQLLRDPLSRRVSMERKFYSVSYVPDDPDFLGYLTLKELTASAITSANDPGASIILLIKGAQSNQQFEIEAVGYWEMIGSLIGSSNTTFTKSHSDILGLGAAIGSLPSKISQKSSEALESSILKKAGQYLLTGTSYVVGAALPPLLGSVAKAAFTPQQLQYPMLQQSAVISEVD